MTCLYPAERDHPPLSVPVMRRYPLAGYRRAPRAVTARDVDEHAPPPRNVEWFRIRAAATTGGRALIDIYGEIGYWGVEAAQFLAELRSLDASELEIHLNSPGGDVFDGLAIYQALVDHPAHVEMRVDGIAASIASIIAQAGDKIIMGGNAQMMIHDAWGLTVGNAGEHRRAADDLDRVSDNLADVYATRAGRGTVKSWRKTMEAETWFSAQEAVDAGLADQVAKTGKRGDDPAALWRAELAQCRYQGRAAAPAPVIPPVKAAADTEPEVEPVPDVEPELDDVEPEPEVVPTREPGAEPAPGPGTDVDDAGSGSAGDDDSGGGAGLAADDVLALIAAHFPAAPAPPISAETVTTGLTVASTAFTATLPDPPAPPPPPAPEPEPEPVPEPHSDALVSAETVTAGIAAASTTIVPDRPTDRSVEWVLAATKAAAALPGPDLVEPPAQPTHNDDIRRNFLEAMLP